MERPVIHATSKDNVIATYRALILLIWREGVDVAAAEQYRKIAVGLGHKFPAGTGSIQIVEPASSVPSSEVRNILASVPEQLGAVPTFVAVVAEGESLRSSLVRGVVTGVSLLMRKRLPMGVFSDLREAAAFAAKQLPSAGYSAEEIVSALNDVRAQVG
jgi:hypothetical protein